MLCALEEFAVSASMGDLAVPSFCIAEPQKGYPLPRKFKTLQNLVAVPCFEVQSAGWEGETYIACVIVCVCVCVDKSPRRLGGGSLLSLHSQAPWGQSPGGSLVRHPRTAGARVRARG